MRTLVVFVILLFVPLASAAQLAFVGDESLRELPGSGTSADPYLLRDLVINATNNTGILIKNTSAFILIKNVSIVGENKRPGIILENVKNVRIENVRIIRCSYGIKIVSSKNITIVNSIFKGNLYCYWKSEFAGDADCRGGAIFADYSRNLYIINNSFVPYSSLFSNIYGVYLVSVRNSKIYNNWFVGSIKCYPSAAFGGYCKGAAIYLTRSNENEIVGNLIYLPMSGGMEYASEVYGIYLSGVNNSIYLNDFYGEEVSYQIDMGIGFYYVFPRSKGKNTFHSPKVVYEFANETFEGFLGNYWDSYKEVDTEGDGIIDTPFIVDHYPLALPSENYKIIRPAEKIKTITNSSTLISNTSATPSSILSTSSTSSPTFSQEEENLKYMGTLLVLATILIILWRRK